MKKTGKRKENVKIVERIDTNTGMKKKTAFTNKSGKFKQFRYFRRKLTTAVRNIM